MSGRPCRKIFNDLELLLSTLQYAEVFASPETPPLSADGVLAGARCTFLATDDNRPIRVLLLFDISYLVSPQTKPQALDSSRTTCILSRL